MTVIVEVPEEIEAQLMAEASARGVPISDYIRDFVLDHYREDMDDLRVAQERLNDPLPGITSAQMRRNLGLDS